MFAYCLNNPVILVDNSGNAAHICFSPDGQQNKSPWKIGSPGGGGLPQDIHYSQQDYGTVADKFYTVRAAKFVGKQIAHTAKILSDAYMQGYNMQQEAQRVEVELISTVAPRVRMAGVKGGVHLVICAFGDYVKNCMSQDTPQNKTPQKEPPKLTLAGLGATFAVGYVGAFL